MSAQITNYRVTVLLRMTLDGIADIADKTERLCGLHPDFETLFRHPYQFFLFRSCLTNDKHTGSIRIISVQDSRNVHINDISLFQYLIFAGNAVADHFVDGSTDTFRESFIIERSRNSSMRNGIIINQLIDLGGRHTSLDFFCDQIEHPGIHHTAPADTFDLFCCLDQFA